jgi:hypothetical protein
MYTEMDYCDSFQVTKEIINIWILNQKKVEDATKASLGEKMMS